MLHMKFVPWLLVLFSVSFSFVSCSRQCPKKTELRTLYVFGDSLFDAGNNPYLGQEDRYNPSYYPYGFAYFLSSTGRLSDGRIVPDFISQFANLGLIPPSREPGANFTNGVNFASAGATALYTPDKTSGLERLDLPQQMSDFKEYVKSLTKTLGETAARQKLAKAVYLFSIGGNDYLTFYGSNHSTEAEAQRAYVEVVIGNITDAILEIHNEGGRKFAFQNVGPMGCLPMTKAINSKDGKCIDLLLQLPSWHNGNLSEALKNMTQSHPGFKYSIFNYYNALLDRILHPIERGFTNGTVACCGDANVAYRNCGGPERYNFTLCDFPSRYVFFDGGHTTQHNNLQLARLIWDGKEPVTGPYNVKQLFDED